jgi:hypothetical protein
MLTVISDGISVFKAYDRLGRRADGTYDWQGSRYHLFRRAWWKQPISGSGAWSSGDSWATNITTGLVVVTTCLAATTASSTLFPGVALDRFAMVNIVAGVFVVAAPVVFGILYAFFTGRYPGPSADSSVRVPLPDPARLGALDHAADVDGRREDHRVLRDLRHWRTARRDRKCRR